MTKFLNGKYRWNSRWKKRRAPNCGVLKNYNQFKMTEKDCKNSGGGKQGHFALSIMLSTLVTIAFHLFPQKIGTKTKLLNVSSKSKQ